MFPSVAACSALDPDVTTVTKQIQTSLFSWDWSFNWQSVVCMKQVRIGYKFDIDTRNIN